MRAAALVGCVALLAACGAQAATVPSLRPALDVGGPDQTYLLEIWVNGQNRHDVIPVTEKGGALFAAARDLQAAGLKFDNSGGDISLGTLPGVAARLEENQQRLMLTADPAHLQTQVFDLHDAGFSMPDRAATGLILTYDTLITTDDIAHPADSSVFSGDAQMDLFTPWASFTSGAVLTHGTPVRLDSTLEVDWAESLDRALAGDLVTGALDWSRPVRLGGVQWASDFTLQPNFISYPLPQFFGQTALPATVDVLVNSAQTMERNVAPGPFELRDLPVTSGADTIQVVTRDLLGQQVVTSIPLYTSTSLLSPGLWSWAFDAGALRRAWGLESFDYGDGAATATARYGVSDTLTVEAHAELAEKVALLGGAADMALWNFGVAGVNFATGKDGGLQYGFSFESRADPITLFASGSFSNAQWRDLASLSGTPAPRLRLQLGGSLALEKGSAISASWVETEKQDEPLTELLTASYTKSIAQGWLFGLTGLYDKSAAAWSGEMFLTIPLGQARFGNLDAQAGPGYQALTESVAQTPDPDGGLALRGSISQGNNQIIQGQADWYEPYGQLTVAASQARGRTATELGYSGGLVAMDDELFLTPRPDGPVALVKTGRAGVTVRQENRDVAVTDGDGEALLTKLTANTPNHIAIDQTQFPLDAIITNGSKSVAPPRASGVVVDLTPPKSHPVIFTLLMPDGVPAPAGTHVGIGTSTLLAGRDGQVFSPDLALPAAGVLTTSAGACRFALTATAGGHDEITRLPAVRCGYV